jgi:ABC-2 type transport system ATP-binding protein
LSNMIELDHLTKKFGALIAVDDISMSVARGEVLGFLGPNGAGKSTTMKIVAGFLEPTSGAATVCGHNVVANPVDVKKRIGYLPEGAPTYGDMTPTSYLGFIAEIRGFDGAEKHRRVAAAVEKLGLERVLRQPIETLSKGYKRRVGFAQAILHDPEVLIMDEPTDGLDPNQKRQVRTLIREMAADKAIVISTHILEEVDAVCNRVVMIAGGRLLADGTPQSLRARARDHNSLLVRVAPEKVEAARGKIASLDGMSSVETVTMRDGSVLLRVPPGAQTRAAAIVGALSGENIEIEELVNEVGLLDDVFYDITAHAAHRENPYA